MSIDTVEDLQAAEDHIGVLEAAIAAVVAAVKVRTQMPHVFDAAVENLSGLATYCRASCAAGECDDDCGCQAHGDGPHPGWSPQRRLGWIIDESMRSIDELRAERLDERVLRTVVRTFASSAPDTPNGRWAATCQRELDRREAQS